MEAGDFRERIPGQQGGGRSSIIGRVGGDQIPVFEDQFDHLQGRVTSPRPALSTHVTNFPIEVYGDRLAIALLLDNHLWRPPRLGEHIRFINQSQNLITSPVKDSMNRLRAIVRSMMHHMVDAVLRSLRTVNQPGG